MPSVWLVNTNRLELVACLMDQARQMQHVAGVLANSDWRDSFHNDRCPPCQATGKQTGPGQLSRYEQDVCDKTS
jgi:hypothetical protein